MRERTLDVFAAGLPRLAEGVGSVDEGIAQDFLAMRERTLDVFAAGLPRLAENFHTMLEGLAEVFFPVRERLAQHFLAVLERLAERFRSLVKRPGQRFAGCLELIDSNNSCFQARIDLQSGDLVPTDVDSRAATEQGNANRPGVQVETRLVHADDDPAVDVEWADSGAIDADPDATVVDGDAAGSDEGHSGSDGQA